MVEMDEIDMSRSELKKLWDGCERPEEAIPVRADDDDCEEDRKIVGHVSKTVLLPGMEDGDFPDNGDTISVQVCLGHLFCLVPVQVREITGNYQLSVAAYFRGPETSRVSHTGARPKKQFSKQSLELLG